MNTPKLLYPPIKHTPIKQMPKTLIVHSYTRYLNNFVDQFVLVPTNKDEFGKKVIMKCFPEYIEREGIKNVPSLYIWELLSNCSGSHYGSKMLDFARNYSKKIGCNGYIHLSSDGCYNPHRMPHIFYRKYGMSTKSARIDKKLDKFIAQGKNATYKDFNTEEMFYPPIQHPNKMLNFAIKLISTLFP